MSWGCVLLTTGSKPAELELALASLRRQTVPADIFVVGNGWDPGPLGIHLPVDDGIPAGRNAGVPHVGGDLLFFLDDDAWLPDHLARCADAAELQTFLAMTLHNLGRSKEAVELLLAVLARTSADPEVQAYREAILFYARDIERAWPEAG